MGKSRVVMSHVRRREGKGEGRDVIMPQLGGQRDGGDQNVWILQGQGVTKKSGLYKEEPPEERQTRPWARKFRVGGRYAS